MTHKSAYIIASIFLNHSLALCSGILLVGTVVNSFSFMTLLIINFVKKKKKTSTGTEKKNIYKILIYIYISISIY